MNNSTSVLHKIATLYAEQLMSDICLVVGSKRYPAHRVILCASSEVFQVFQLTYIELENMMKFYIIKGYVDEPGVV